MERRFRHLGDGQGIQLVLIFGVGLIGETLVSELSLRGFLGKEQFAFSWLQPPSTRVRELDTIFEWTRKRTEVHAHGGMPADQISISIVWSAGKSGFVSTWEALDTELNAFRQVVSLSVRLLEVLPRAVHNFHLTSSGGGVYEGQLNVGPGAVPFPLRPYGELKMAQERLLHALEEPIGKSIYRPSSVYGFISLKNRLGLIATLINNGMRGQITNIFADALTLRDYVLVNDVAAFIAKKITVDRFVADGTYVLASAKPTSVNEVLILLERVLDRTLYFVFRPTLDNTASNTFSVNVLPDGFHPQDLETGMRSVLFSMQHQFSHHFH